MASLSLDDFLNILFLIWDFMKTHGFNVTIGGQTYILTFSVIIIGLFIVGVVMTLIDAVWWGE